MIFLIFFSITVFNIWLLEKKKEFNAASEAAFKGKLSNPLWLNINFVWDWTEACLEYIRTSTMELFAKIVNGF